MFYKLIAVAFLSLIFSTQSFANIGTASWYGPGFHGKKTASGERFNQHAMTAAHRTLPLGSKVRVTNLKTNKSVIVTINDRGPFARGRIIDLSKGAAQTIGIAGTGKVSIARID
jgi:rare lipoprotein A